MFKGALCLLLSLHKMREAETRLPAAGGLRGAGSGVDFQAC